MDRAACASLSRRGKKPKTYDVSKNVGECGGNFKDKKVGGCVGGQTCKCKTHVSFNLPAVRVVKRQI